MAAGQQPTLDAFNNQLTSCALRMRELMHDVADLNLQVGKLGTDGLLGLGASVDDAADIVSKAATLNTPAAIYYGEATQATPFDFDDALAPLWAGQ